MADPFFSPLEYARYSRHLLLPHFGIEAQKKLKQAKVLVIGAGGLGSPLLAYLSAAGVGTIGIIDHDRVDLSNLQRQVLFTTEDLGKSKVEAARARLQALNPHVQFLLYNEELNSRNALDIIRLYDVIADGSDNFPTRYLVNDACVFAGKPLVYGAVFRFEGQVAVFNQLNSNGKRGPNYRDLYPTPPPPELVPSCSEGGVLGVLPGIIGSMQALETIKLITGVGETLSGRYLIFDALGFQSRTFQIKSRPDNPISGTNPGITVLVDYEHFCGTPAAGEKIIKEITATRLKEWKDRGELFQLIDVREPYEKEIVDIAGELIPAGILEQNPEKLRFDIPVILHCKSGSRSAALIRKLESRFGYTNLYNLKGGIIAYTEEVDPFLNRY